MGQGQEVHSRRLVSQSMQDGCWVLLHNCHLGLDYMDELLDTLTNTEQINEEFRLWVTTEVQSIMTGRFIIIAVAYWLAC